MWATFPHSYVYAISPLGPRSSRAFGAPPPHVCDAAALSSSGRGGYIPSQPFLADSGKKMRKYVPESMNLYSNVLGERIARAHGKIEISAKLQHFRRVKAYLPIWALPQL